MIRPAFAAFLGAAFGALAFPGARDRLVQVPPELADLTALWLVATAASLIGIALMSCREAPRIHSRPHASPFISHERWASQPRDAAGRFTKDEP